MAMSEGFRSKAAGTQHNRSKAMCTTTHHNYSRQHQQPPPHQRLPHTLSTLCPSRRSWSTRARACTYGLYLARIARMEVGS